MDKRVVFIILILVKYKSDCLKTELLNGGFITKSDISTEDIIGAMWYLYLTHKKDFWDIIKDCRPPKEIVDKFKGVPAQYGNKAAKNKVAKMAQQKSGDDQKWWETIIDVISGSSESKTTVSKPVATNAMVYLAFGMVAASVVFLIWIMVKK